MPRPTHDGRTGASRSGTTPWSPPATTTWRPGPSWKGTSTSTSASSVQGSPGSGPRTTLLRGPVRAGRRARGRDRRVRRQRTQRRLVLGALPGLCGSARRRHGREAALAMRRAMNATVAEVGRVVAAEGIDAHWRQGGTVVLARTPVQLERARAAVAADAALRRRRRRCPARRGGGGAARGGHPRARRDVHPALRPGAPRTARPRAGPSRRAARRQDPRAHPGGADRAGAEARVETAGGTVRADVVVRATEALDAGAAGQRPGGRAPSTRSWSRPSRCRRRSGRRAGCAAGETFSDHRHLIIYGQRTADDRIAFGGRGAPYHAGSRIEPRFDRDRGSSPACAPRCWTSSPACAGTRSRTPGVGRSASPGTGTPASASTGRPGSAWAGGYVGDGVGTSNLAGRTLADLVLGRDTELTRLPWVGHRSPRWEPEPLRWLGVNAGLRAMTTADAEERLTGRPSLAARVLAPCWGMTLGWHRADHATAVAPGSDHGIDGGSHDQLPQHRVTAARSAPQPMLAITCLMRV